MQTVKMILTYDIRREVSDSYYQFVLGEMVPTLQSLGLAMSGAWHTAYGNYPMRLVEFIAEDPDVLDRVLTSASWEQLENTLQHYVHNYHRKVVPLRDGQFQF
jgi:hypothetical protein